MLEDKINMIKKGLSAAGIALWLSCAPSATVPVRYVTAEGIKSNNISCCSVLDCSNYDGCRVETKGEYHDGVFRDTCSCYSIATASGTSSPPIYNDNGPNANDFPVRRSGERRGGHWECKTP